jgi:hypothetical protein
MRPIKGNELSCFNFKRFRSKAYSSVPDRPVIVFYVTFGQSVKDRFDE